MDIAKNAPLRFGGEFTKNLTKTVLKGEPIVSQGIVTKSGTTSIDTLMYVFNYAEGGYAVVPTLDVESDLIAYVEEGEFNIQDTLTNDLSRFLISLMIDYQRSEVLKYEKELDTKNSSLVVSGGQMSGPMCGSVIAASGIHFKYLGEPTQTPEYVGRKGDDYYKKNGCYLPLQYTEVEDKYLEPLLTTTWKQEEPYNWQGPKIGNKYPKAGCVAIAVSQIMTYHAYPTKYPNTILNFNMPSELKAYVNTNTALVDLRRKKTITTTGSPGARDYGPRFIAIIGYMLGNEWGVDGTSSNIGAAYSVFGGVYPRRYHQLFGYSHRGIDQWRKTCFFKRRQR